MSTRRNDEIISQIESITNGTPLVRNEIGCPINRSLIDRVANHFNIQPSF